jgi:hypothetical protein
VKPAYPFGFGLSYTSFAYWGLKLGAAEFDREITADVTVRNSGKAAGREVGTYTVKVGASSEDIRQTASFTKARAEKVALVATAVGRAGAPGAAKGSPQARRRKAATTSSSSASTQSAARSIGPSGEGFSRGGR